MGLFDLSTDRNLLYWNRPMNADKLYTSLSANTIMAKLTNHTGQTYITPSPDKHYSRDSIQVLETSVNNIFLRTNLTRTISKSYELFLGLNNTTCCLFFYIYIYRNLLHDSQSCHQDLCSCECKKYNSSNWSMSSYNCNSSGNALSEKKWHRP